jgi:hypothetical protein
MQVVFAGDSLMRKLYYEFTQSVITTSVSTRTYKAKKDKTILRAEDMDLSTQFIWAPYAKRRNKDLGGDSRTVFPYEAILGELFSPQPPSNKTSATTAEQSLSPAAPKPRLQGRTQEVGEGASAELCRVGVGQGRHQTWERFCARPSALVLSVGLWQTESWQSNVADFTAMIRAEEAKAQAAGRPPLKIIVLLPFPVRHIRSDIPASGLQEDPNVEEQCVECQFCKKQARYIVHCLYLIPSYAANTDISGNFPYPRRLPCAHLTIGSRHCTCLAGTARR